MAGVNLNEWAKGLVERLNEKISHVHEIVEQKLEYQHKYLEQRLTSISEGQSEKLLNFSVRLEEALAEIRNYKDILQQQLTLLDNSTKKAHTRLDELESQRKQEMMQIESQIEMINSKLSEFDKVREEILEDLKTLKEQELIETTQREARKNDPVRKFLSDNGQKVLLFVLAGLGLYLLRNLGQIIEFIAGLG